MCIHSKQVDFSCQERLTKEIKKNHLTIKEGDYKFKNSFNLNKISITPKHKNRFIGFAVGDGVSSYNKSSNPQIMVIDTEQRYITRKEQFTYKSEVNELFRKDIGKLIKELTVIDFRVLRYILTNLSAYKTRIHRGAIADKCFVCEKTVSNVTTKLAQYGLISKEYFDYDASDYMLSEFFLKESIRQALYSFIPGLKYITSYKCIFKNMYTCSISFLRSKVFPPNIREEETTTENAPEVEVYDPNLDIYEEIDTVLEF